jgi:hypothetical protein
MNQHVSQAIDMPSCEMHFLANCSGQVTAELVGLCPGMPDDLHVDDVPRNVLPPKNLGNGPDNGRGFAESVWLQSTFCWPQTGPNVSC